jgi:hypothetical protein
MCLVVEEVEVEEVPQPVVAEVVVVEEEVVVGAEAAVLEEVAVAAVVVDMIFCIDSTHCAGTNRATLILWTCRFNSLSTY